MNATVVVAGTGEVVTITGTHPVADLFPMLADDELNDLAADIADRGLLHPVVLDTESRVLDGRNRLAACDRAGVKATATVYDGPDPDGYALAVNIERRNITKGQRGVILARFLEKHPAVLRHVANEVSKATISKANVVLRHAPDLVEGVESGYVPLNEAYEEARARKQAADGDEARMTRLRADAPDLADLVTEERVSLSEAVATARQREDDRQGAIRRTAERLEQLVVGWLALTDLTAHRDRDDVLGRLNSADRARVLDIEHIYVRGTS